MERGKTIKKIFREKMKTSEWACDRTKEASDLVAQDEARKVSIVEEIMLRSTDYLRRIIASVGGQGGVTMSYLCPHRNSFSARLRLVGLWVKGHKVVLRNLWREVGLEASEQAFGRANRESFEQAKVFKAHAVPQGLCANLINALKLLANQQEDEDGLLQNIVTNLGKVSRKGFTDGMREFIRVDNDRWSATPRHGNF